MSIQVGGLLLSFIKQIMPVTDILFYKIYRETRMLILEQGRGSEDQESRMYLGAGSWVSCCGKGEPPDSRME